MFETMNPLGKATVDLQSCLVCWLMNELNDIMPCVNFNNGVKHAGLNGSVKLFRPEQGDF